MVTVKRIALWTWQLWSASREIGIPGEEDLYRTGLMVGLASVLNEIMGERPQQSWSKARLKLYERRIRSLEESP